MERYSYFIFQDYLSLLGFAQVSVMAESNAEFEDVRSLGSGLLGEMANLGYKCSKQISKEEKHD
jgi:hypothetical protein